MRNLIGPYSTALRRIAGACLALGLMALAAAQAPAQAPTQEREYELLFRLDLTAGSSARNASIVIGRGAESFRELRMDFDPSRFRDFLADGDLVLADASLTWRPPRSGGRLTYRADITHRRLGAGYDARIASEWALFRARDAFPAATARALRGARSTSTLELLLPSGWSAITRYREGDGPPDDRAVFSVGNEGRGFARPGGWILAGSIGVRRARIARTRVALAAPVGEGFRPMDTMAFLNGTLPELSRLFPSLDERLVIVSAGDPMWRGGLSGPGSLYVHADSPLISENGTSTLLHELVEVAMGVAGPGHDDWLVEGLAEYYAIKILNGSGTLSRRRSAITLERLAELGEDVDDIFLRRASGEITARAVTLLAALDAELRLHAPEREGLDAVVTEMAAGAADFSYRELCRTVEKVYLVRARALTPDEVPGAPAVEDCLAD